MASYDLITGQSQLRALHGEWNELLARCQIDEPTRSPLWQLAWWQIYGDRDGRQPRVLCVRDGGRLVGVIPLLWRSARGPSRLPLRRLELWGSGEREFEETCSDHIGMLAEIGYEQRVARIFSRALLKGELGPWDELLLVRMPGDDPMVSLLHEMLRGEGWMMLFIAGCAPYITLPASWEAYLGNLPGSRRRRLLRTLRAFERWSEGDYAIERAVDEPTRKRGFSILEQLHELRWSASGRPGVFAAENFRAFHQRVTRSLLEAGALDLSWLTVRGEPTAALYNICWRGKVHYYQSGRRPDLPAKAGVGIVLHAHAIQRAIAAGAREYDMLDGVSSFKLQLTTDLRPLRTLRVLRPSATTRLDRAVERTSDWLRAVRNAWRTSASHPRQPPSSVE